jgi:transposase-like protein
VSAPRKRKTGRPAGVTPARQRAICDAVGKGMSVSAAARLAGLSPSTVLGWRQKGEDDPEGTFRPFAEALARARAKGMEALVDVIRDAAVQGDWRAAHALLRSSWGDEYGQPKRVEVSGPEGRPIELRAGPTAVIQSLGGRSPLLFPPDVRDAMAEAVADGRATIQDVRLFAEANPQLEETTAEDLAAFLAARRPQIGDGG